MAGAELRACQRLRRGGNPTGLGESLVAKVDRCFAPSPSPLRRAAREGLHHGHVRRH